MIIACNDVDGQWTEPMVDTFCDVHNPSTGDLIGKTPLSTGEQAAHAIEAAHSAYRHTSASDRVCPIFQISNCFVSMQSRSPAHLPKRWASHCLTRVQR